MSPRKPRRGVKNSGRWWSEAKPLLRIQWVKKCRRPDRKSVTPSGFLFPLVWFCRGSFSATLRKRLLRRRASLRSTTCLCSVALSALYGITSYIIPMSSSIQSIAFMLLSQCSRIFRALLSCSYLNAPVSSEQCSRDAISMLPFSKLT